MNKLDIEISRLQGLLGQETMKRQQLEKEVEKLKKEKSELIDWVTKKSIVPESIKTQDNAGAIMVQVTAMAYDSMLSHIRTEDLINKPTEQ